ncbi:MAG: hypothetical protein DI556_05110 [Rhodovulum sulfidophilum]|uniref:Uncharacterized protein n=1 Tax=Rhodovulum sulfidophilum TaxID=35806 RepID=A0A2W5NL20_RHOSU|nr:MAG: hypothetical protein DI556_05110 [Rhodovulum sulfidophilum]
MKTNINLLAAAAIALSAAAPAFAANDQLVAAAGLSQAEASDLSLAEIAQAKFNRGDRGDATPLIVAREPASAANRDRFARSVGVSSDEAEGLSLGQLAAIKFNRTQTGGDRLPVKGAASIATRSAQNPAARAQLIANAGLDQDEAAGLTLTEIAQAKFNRDTDQ